MRRVRWLEWAHEGQVVVVDLDAGQDLDLISRLLDALKAASSELTGKPWPAVELVEAALVPDVDHPDYQMGPCNKLINVYTQRRWSMAPERFDLWTILARHYMHAHNRED